MTIEHVEAQYHSNMRHLFVIAALLISGCASTTQTVGVVSEIFRDTDRNRSLEAYIWFPTNSSAVERIDRTRVYAGFEAVPGASIDVDDAPIIFLLHGSYGNRSSLAWLAVELARRGAVVVAANHPGSTTGNASPQSLIEVWHQPQDVKFLYRALTTSAIGENIDRSRYSVVGTSLGGYSALALAGARLEIQRFAEFCSKHDDGACAELIDAVESTDRDFAMRANDDFSDPQLAASVSIAPGFTESMTERSIRALDVPVLVVGAELDDQVPVETHARPLSRLLPSGSRYFEVQGATHFSFLPNCVSGALAILAEDSEEFVCKEKAEKTRDQIHSEVVGEVEAFLVRLGLL